MASRDGVTVVREGDQIRLAFLNSKSTPLISEADARTALLLLGEVLSESSAVKPPESDAKRLARSLETALKPNTRSDVRAFDIGQALLGALQHFIRN